jgi:hypothetical protein
VAEKASTKKMMLGCWDFYLFCTNVKLKLPAIPNHEQNWQKENLLFSE